MLHEGLERLIMAHNTQLILRLHCWWRCLASFFVVATSFGALCQPADLIFTNGKVLTVDSHDSVAEALAVRGDRIIAVGTKTDVDRFRTQSTTVIDLRGRSLIPGLIDSHTHPTGASLIEWDHPIPRMDSVSDVLDYVRGRAAIVPAGDWIVLQQVFITRLQERRYPTRAELDAVAPQHPVVFRTGPDASLNSEAMKQLEIDRDSVAPEGSKIERHIDSTEPTGIIRNWSRIFSIPKTGEEPTEAEKRIRIQQLFRDYNSVGLTSIADRNASAAAMKRYQGLLDENQLTVRIAASRGVSNVGSPSQMIQQIDLIAAEPASHSTDSMLRTIGIKMFLDGGMLTGSAFMIEPWGVSSIYNISDPSYRGLRFIPQETLIKVIKHCIGQGLQYTAHSVGDGAVETLVAAYEQIGLEGNQLYLTRPNITHCNFLSDESIAKMAELGISADIQPAWLFKDAKTLTEQFGLERMKRFQPLRKLFDSGVLIGGGSDHMQKIGSLRSVNPYNPFLGMWIAMTRIPENAAEPIHRNQALTRLEALRFYTRNNARLLFLENVCGSLEVDKKADLVVLDRDFLECPTAAIRELNADQVYLSGQLIHQRSSDH